MKSIVLFDMDGTLIDSALDITLSINHVRSEGYALEPLSVQAVVDAINAPVRNLAEIFYGTSLYEARARDIFEEHYYDQCIQNVKPYSGIPALLETLHHHGHVMGVATNAPTLFAKRMLEHLNLDSYFRLIIGADEVDTPKPHPQMLIRHLEHYDFHSGTDCAWMIGDNSKDMEAASRAGIIGIFAGWGFSAEGDGDYFAPSPEALYDIICLKG